MAIVNENENKNEKSKKIRYACKTCETEAPRKEGFNKHGRTVQEKYKSNCNHCGKEVSLRSEIKIRTQPTHEEHETNCDQCGKEPTLRNNPEEFWDPGIHIEITVTEDKLILLVIKVKTTQTISDIYAKSKVMQRMGANIDIANIDAQMQDLLITSRGIRDGWIETVQLLRNTIQNKAMQEEEARAEAVAAESIRAAAITAIRAANIAGHNARWLVQTLPQLSS